MKTIRSTKSYGRKFDVTMEIQKAARQRRYPTRRDAAKITTEEYVARFCNMNGLKGK